MKLQPDHLQLTHAYSEGRFGLLSHEKELKSLLSIDRVSSRCYHRSTYYRKHAILEMTAMSCQERLLYWVFHSMRNMSKYSSNTFGISHNLKIEVITLE